jgi:hypothetical protein
MAVVSAMNVHRTSCESLLCLASYKIESIIRRAMPISLSHEPPICEEYGVDCFGPWDIVTRRTRGGSVNSKRWAVLFSCLSCRAVHIEVIEEMSTSSFINAFRRFMAIRGKVKEF